MQNTINIINHVKIRRNKTIQLQRLSPDFCKTSLCKTNTSYPQECGKTGVHDQFSTEKNPVFFVDLPSKNISMTIGGFTTRTVDESPSPYLRNRTFI